MLSYVIKQCRMFLLYLNDGERFSMIIKYVFFIVLNSIVLSSILRLGDSTIPRTVQWARGCNQSE